MSRLQNLIGQKFNRLTVISRAENTKSGMTCWLCQCDCGKQKIVAGKHLKSGRIKSCGCYNHDSLVKRNTTHGLTNTRLFRIWGNMKDRCYNPNKSNYPYYGGRGIQICQEWLDNFENFYVWAINNGYQRNLSIDRINGNGNYEPSNCRWVTQKEQNNNRRDNKLITFKNETHTIPEWAEKLKINKHSLSTAIYRDKRSFEDATQRLGVKWI